MIAVWRTRRYRSLEMRSKLNVPLSAFSGDLNSHFRPKHEDD